MVGRDLLWSKLLEYLYRDIAFGILLHIFQQGVEACGRGVKIVVKARVVKKQPKRGILAVEFLTKPDQRKNDRDQSTFTRCQ